MITGVHTVIFSKDAEADRSFLKEVLQFDHVDVGQGWLIFALPPAEMAVHPSSDSEHHELYFMCDDINKFVKAMDKHGYTCSSVKDEGWGLLVQLTLPGGGKIGVYEPRHERPN